MFDRVSHSVSASLAATSPANTPRPGPARYRAGVTDLTALPPLLLPAPRRLRTLPAAGSPASTPPTFTEDASLPAEGYRLQIDAETGILIHASTPTGRAHALRTLAQLRLQYPDVLPALRIEDAPALRTRGVMLDVSRCRVPTMPALLAQTDLFASLKLNHLQLYIEHAFAYAGHEQVWAGVDPITPAELRRLDAHASGLGIALAASQNCFGHMARWLSLPGYARLAETHGEFDFYGIPRRGPFSLCPTDPASLELVTDLLSQQVACVSSGLVNIGCDETADLGAGRSRAAVEQRGRPRVYLDYVRSVCDIAQSLDARPMLWGDVILGEPALAAELPESAIVLAWGYEPDSPFDDWGQSLGASGREWLACPGTSSWRSFTGRTHERRTNLDIAVRSALEHNASGLLITDWGDLGHRQQAPIAQLAIAEAAAASWNPDVPADPRAISLHVFADSSLSIATWLGELGDADRPLRAISGAPASDGSVRALRNASALFEHLHPSGADTALPQSATPWRETLARLDALQQTRPSGLAPLLTDQLDHTLDVARFSAMLAIAEREFTSPTPPELADRLGAIIETHRRLWARDSRPGGLDESTSHFADLTQRVRRTL